mmetsp:Transcript_12439/g.25331  ORF Transcript_12439/g.25331 Transcript_12439/m.25331 type:complete len:505 (+) Transcript_12439:87-1601(+)
MPKFDEEVHKLKRLRSNKKCFTCKSGVSSYVATPYNVFVCDTCGGILRESGFKAKGIAMTSWTGDDVKNIKEGGNKNAKKYFLKGFDTENLPDSNDSSAIRAFIRAVFIEKKYQRKKRTKKTRRSPAASRSEIEPVAEVKGKEAANPVNPAPTNNTIFPIDFVVEEEEGPIQREEDNATSEVKHSRTQSHASLEHKANGVNNQMPPMDTGSMFGPDKSFATIATEDTGGAQKDQGTRSAFQVGGVLDDLIDANEQTGGGGGGGAVDFLTTQFGKVMKEFGLDMAGMESAVQKALKKVMSTRETTAKSNSEAQGLVAPTMPDNLFPTQQLEEKTNQDFAPQFPGGGGAQAGPGGRADIKMPSVGVGVGGVAAAAGGGVFDNVGIMQQPNPNPNQNNLPFGVSPAFPGTMQTPQPAQPANPNAQPPDQMRNPFDDDEYDPSFDPSRPNPFEMADGRGTAAGAAFSQPRQPSQLQPQQPAQQAPAVQKQPSKDDIFAFADPFKGGLG